MHRAKLSLRMFAVALGLAAIICLWGVRSTYRQLRALYAFQEGVRNKAVGEYHAQYQAVGDQVAAKTSELDALLLRVATRGNPADVRTFQTNNQQFRDWLRQQLKSAPQSKLVNSDILPFIVDLRNLLDQADLALTQFTEGAQSIIASSLQPAEHDRALDQFAALQTTAHQLLTLAGEAHAQAKLLNTTPFIPIQRITRVLAGFLLTLLLAGLCGWLAWVARRRELAFVHHTLRERDAIIERQQKLAHFGQLAAGLAHEIRNPLAAVNARLFLLQHALDKESNGYRDTIVIREEIHRLDQIVTGFLNLARPAPPALEPMSAGPLLHEVAELLGPALTTRSVQLTVDSAVPALFRGDRQQLKQVLINLAQNAAESMPNGGRIILRARQGESVFRGRPSSDAVVIEVEDDGPGIPADIQARMFDPFFSTKKQGIGLGLSISANIVERHGGSLEYRTAFGRGTTFGIKLPAGTGAP